MSQHGVKPAQPVVIDITPTIGEQAPGKVLRCGVIGVGRMGKNHAKKYTLIPGAKLVGVVDASAERREDAAEVNGCAAYGTVEELLKAGVDAVTIATPTVNHLAAAEPLLKAGVACLIEKPLAATVEEAQRLVDLSKRTGTVLMVGHIERFNPAVVALQRAQEADIAAGGKGIVPRFIEVHRVSQMTFRSVDVSVVMDMMIHDLDVVLMLMGGVEPSHVEASGVPVLTEHEDVCNARLTFNLPHGRCVATIASSRLAFKSERKIRIVGENGYVSIDFAKKSGVLIRRTANEVQMHAIREELRKGTDLSDLNYKDLVAIEELKIDNVDQLELEVRSFLDAVRTGSNPPIDAQAGFANVRTAQRIMNEARRDWKK